MQRRLQDADASAFRADQGAGEVAIVFRQKIVEVVAGNTPRQLRITAANLIAIFADKSLELGVDLADSSTLSDHALHLVRRCLSDTQAQSVVGEDLQLVGVVG